MPLAFIFCAFGALFRLSKLFQRRKVGQHFVGEAFVAFTLDTRE
jgi:hypothetical protein